MDKKLKFFIIAIVGISSFSLLIFFNFNSISNPIEAPKESVNNISLIVDNKNGPIKVHENFTLENNKTSAFDALDKWCDIKYIVYGFGIFVSEIDGIRGSRRQDIERGGGPLQLSAALELYELGEGANRTPPWRAGEGTDLPLWRLAADRGKQGFDGRAPPRGGRFVAAILAIPGSDLWPGALRRASLCDRQLQDLGMEAGGGHRGHGERSRGRRGLLPRRDAGAR